MTLTDNDLIERVDRGDERAFSELVARHHGRIFGVAMKYLRNYSGAQDVAQDVCVKLCTKLQQYERGTNFVTWLHKVTLNTVRDARRKDKTLGDQTTIDDWRDLIPDPAAIDPRRLLVAKETLDEVMNVLSQREAEAVILVCAEGLKHAEAAEVMGCGETSVSGYIHSARKKLARLGVHETEAQQ